MSIGLFNNQIETVNKMKNGCILCSCVGSGKSRTAIGYYYLENGGSRESLGYGQYIPMKNPRDLYIITTAKKRDTNEWVGDMIPFLLNPDPELSLYKNKIVIDSWNNIKKYQNIYGAFFIFDEQRAVGSGSWVKAFLNIAKKNKWVLLSATPGDAWKDYIPVFIANGFYKNKTEFIEKHVVYSFVTRYPKIDRYLDVDKLTYYRELILVDMDVYKKTIRHDEDIFVDYDPIIYKRTMKERWDPFENKPIINASRLCYILRKIVNNDVSRQIVLLELLEKYDKVIIFYNFDYELNILKNIIYKNKTVIAEWNGHVHQQIPETKRWVYLVQYAAGCEGWNCIETNIIVFYSQTYSYRIIEQASGRIDRMNTPYIDLYFYHLKSHASIDLAISRALKNKKKFNERKWSKW